MAQNVCDLGSTVGGQGPRRENIRFAVLKVLQDTADIVLEPLRQRRNILVREHVDEISRLRRIAPNNFNSWFVFENARNFVAGEENRHTPIVPCHPFHQFALSMRIRPIYFIQNNAGVPAVSPHQACDTHGMLGRLNQLFDIGVTSHRLARIDFQRLKLAGPGSSEGQGCFANPRRPVEKQNIVVRRRPKIVLQTLLNFNMSSYRIQELRPPDFAPHTLSSYPCRKCLLPTK